jgi:hypothetical protein
MVVECIYGGIAGVYNHDVADIMVQKLSFKAETVTAVASISSGKQSPENVVVGGEGVKWWRGIVVITSESCDSCKLSLTSTVFQCSLCLPASAQYEHHITKHNSAT